jgi:hypothetical protein
MPPWNRRGARRRRRSPEASGRGFGKRTVSSHVHGADLVRDLGGKHVADEAAIVRQRGRGRGLRLTRDVAPDHRRGDDDRPKPRSRGEAGHGAAGGYSQRFDLKLRSVQHTEKRGGVTRRDGADQKLLGVGANPAAAHRLRPGQLEGKVVGLDLSGPPTAGTRPGHWTSKCKSLIALSPATPIRHGDAFGSSCSHVHSVRAGQASYPATRGRRHPFLVDLRRRHGTRLAAAGVGRWTKRLSARSVRRTLPMDAVH